MRPPWPYPDIRWRNDSDFGVLIKTVSTGTSVTVQLWSTRRYDKIEAVESEKRNFTPFRRETSSAPDAWPRSASRASRST